MSLKKLPELCREASGGKLGALRNLLRFLRKEKVLYVLVCCVRARDRDREGETESASCRVENAKGWGIATE